MATLKKVMIKGFRSIKSMELDLRALNVLIGANGAGKSNFISFFKLLNEMMGGRLQTYIATSGRSSSILHFGPKVTLQLEGRLEFETDDDANWYDMRLSHAEDGSLFFEEETLSSLKTGHEEPRVSTLGSGHQEARVREDAYKGVSIAKVFRHLLNRCRVYHFHETSHTASLRLPNYINENHFLRPDAGNLAAMLFAYREKYPLVYRRIASTIKKIMPEFDDFDLEPERLNPNEIRLNWRKAGQDYLFGPHQISDGSLRAMAICTLLLQPEADLPDVIILDEPELGLHPHALEIVAGLIRAASVKSQVIVATQSESFLNNFEPSEIITAEVHDGQSVFRRLDPDQLRDWLEDYSIGELWQRNVVGGGPLP